MKYFLINAYGKDKVGIVASVSKILYELGFNLEDSTMSRLGGEFTIMLLVETDKNYTEEDIKKAFENIEKDLGLNIYVKEILPEDYKKEKSENEVYRIIVYGADKPGIVYKVAKLLADKGINIIDMTTEKSGDLYVLITEVELPENLSFEEFQKDIENLKEDINVDVSCEKIEVIEL
ncbi:glycine cleavage system protein R [Hydrogenothermus marinus]|uniref:Glycine cleavage system transcriptional repressor n=1 Tax=Hydrogenothermus marinus TaxID=133270 RepID=A0A3M0B7G3_9AQUI|nr:ACT domain-containing protein [Hydrogenothermus marinus]RMA92576.1 glycine cleavage system transcriptional repressor [Hydrogenothermus marinus]